MEIKLSTVHTKERLIRYSDYFAKTRIPYWVGYAVCTLLILVMDAFLIILDAFTAEMIFLTALTVMVDLLMVFMFFIAPRITINKSGTLNAVLHYSFGTSEVCFEAETPMMKDSGSLKYPAIIKVCRNNDDVYLFISKRQAYIVDISTLSDAEIDLFKSLVTGHLPKKMIKW